MYQSDEEENTNYPGDVDIDDDAVSVSTYDTRTSFSPSRMNSMYSTTSNAADGPKLAHVMQLVSKSAVKAMHKTNATVKTTATAIHTSSSAAKDTTTEYLAKKKLEQERDLRFQKGKVNIVDAMLNIRGNLTELPTIDKKWYVAVYPKTNDVNIDTNSDIMDETWRDHENYDDIHQTHAHELPKHGVPNNFKQYQKILDWKQSSEQPITGRKQEYSRSVFMYPFSSDSFLDLSFYCHLLDISRYKSIEFCIFIEGPHDAEPLLPKAQMLDNDSQTGNGQSGQRTNLGYVPQVFEKKNTLQKTVMSYFKKSKFLPGFYAEISISRGCTFAPQGGRMHLTLKPNIPMLLNLPDGHKLANMTGLDVLITMIPIAQPSTLYLRTFRNEYTPTTCYPSTLIDCISCENINTQWDQLNTGRATCCGVYHNRILLGSLNRTPKRTDSIIYEFTVYGKRVGKVHMNEGEERIILIISGQDHIICCYQNGAIVILREKTVIDSFLDSDIITPSTTSTTTTNIENDILPHWTKPLTIQCHPYGNKIISGCCLYHANLDIMFTLDSVNGIGIYILNTGKCIKNHYNYAFTTQNIKQICAYRSILYLGHTDGTLTLINLSIILNGDLDYITQLSRLVVRQDTVITSGISSIALFAANDFIGLKNDDSVKYETRADALENTLRPLQVEDDNIKFDTVEGHMLLIGGDDQNPIVKVMYPYAQGFRELVVLKGHTQAITDILVDAAGRYYITGSRGDKTIRIWDGLTFVCERHITDVSYGDMVIADNVLVVSSITSPFLRFWGVPEKHKHRKSKFQKAITDDNGSVVSSAETSTRSSITSTTSINSTITSTTRLQSLNMNTNDTDASVDDDHNPEYISAIRNPYFCQAMLKGDCIAPSTTWIKPDPKTLDSNYSELLWRWNRLYLRPDSKTPKPIFYPKAKQDIPKTRKKSKVSAVGKFADGVVRLKATDRAKIRREQERALLQLTSRIENGTMKNRPNINTNTEDEDEDNDDMMEDENSTSLTSTPKASSPWNTRNPTPGSPTSNLHKSMNNLSINPNTTTSGSWYNTNDYTTTSGSPKSGKSLTLSDIPENEMMFPLSDMNLPKKQPRPNKKSTRPNFHPKDKNKDNTTNNNISSSLLLPQSPGGSYTTHSRNSITVMEEIEEESEADVDEEDAYSDTNTEETSSHLSSKTGGGGGGAGGSSSSNTAYRNQPPQMMTTMTLSGKGLHSTSHSYKGLYNSNNTSSAIQEYEEDEERDGGDSTHKINNTGSSSSSKSLKYTPNDTKTKSSGSSKSNCNTVPTSPLLTSTQLLKHNKKLEYLSKLSQLSLQRKEKTTLLPRHPHNRINNKFLRAHMSDDENEEEEYDKYNTDEIHEDIYFGILHKRDYYNLGNTGNQMTSKVLSSTLNDKMIQNIIMSNHANNSTSSINNKSGTNTTTKNTGNSNATIVLINEDTDEYLKLCDQSSYLPKIYTMKELWKNSDDEGDDDGDI